MKKFIPSWLNKNIIGFGLASFFGDISYEMTTALLPAFLSQLLASASVPQALGLVSGISDAIASLVKPVFGWLSDYYKRKPFIVVGYALTGVCVSIIGTATNVWQVVLYRTGAWLGKGMREPARDAFITESVDARYYGRAFGFHRAMDSLGSIVGPLLVMGGIYYFSIRTIFLLALIPAFFSVLSVVLLVQEKAHPITAFKRTSFFLHIKQLPPRFRSFIIIMFIFGCGNFSRTLLILYAQQTLAGNVIVTSSIIMGLYALFNAVRAISEYSIGWFSDIIGRTTMLALLGFGLFAGISLCMALGFASWPIIVTLFIVLGVSTAAVSALERACAADLLPPAVRGTGFGTLQTVDGIGDFVSSALVGFLWTWVNPFIAFTYAAVMSIIATLLLLLWKSSKN